MLTCIDQQVTFLLDIWSSHSHVRSVFTHKEKQKPNDSKFASLHNCLQVCRRTSQVPGPSSPFQLENIKLHTAKHDKRWNKQSPHGQTSFTGTILSDQTNVELQGPVMHSVLLMFKIMITEMLILLLPSPKPSLSLGRQMSWFCKGCILCTPADWNYVWTSHKPETSFKKISIGDQKLAFLVILGQLIQALLLKISHWMRSFLSPE